MTKMTIEIPDADYKMLKLAAVHMGVSIKDYVLDAIRAKEKILVRDDGVVRVLKKETVRALEESRKRRNLKSYATIDQLMKDLKS